MDVRSLLFISLLPSFFTTSHSFTLSRSAATYALFPRADICGGDASLERCGTNLPSSFCCPSSSRCIALDTGTQDLQSAICCPAGQSCNFIQPITCDAEEQDPNKHPKALIHLSDTSAKLPRCGSQCCPIGYGCRDGSTCEKGLDPSKSTPTTSTPTGTQSSGPTSSIPIVVPSNLPSSARLPTDAPSASSTFDGGSFAAGWFPGMILGALIAILLAWWWKRRQSTKHKKSGSIFEEKEGRPWPINRTISEPVYDPQYGHRVDFIRRGTYDDSPPNSLTLHENKQFDSKSTRSSIFGATPIIKALFSRSPKAPETDEKTLNEIDDRPNMRRQNSDSTVFTNNTSTSRNEWGGRASTGTIDIAMPTMPSSVYSSVQYSPAPPLPTGPALGTAVMSSQRPDGNRSRSQSRGRSRARSLSRPAHPPALRIVTENENSESQKVPGQAFLMPPPLFLSESEQRNGARDTTCTTMSGIMRKAGWAPEEKMPGGLFVDSQGSPHRK